MQTSLYQEHVRTTGNSFLLNSPVACHGVNLKIKEMLKAGYNSHYFKNLDAFICTLKFGIANLLIVSLMLTADIHRA